MFEYRFPKDGALLASIMAHFTDDIFGIEVISVELVGKEYVLKTAKEMPEDQLEHLQMTRV